MTMRVRVEIFPSDLDRAVDFWTGVMGFTLAGDWRGSDSPYVSFVRGTVQVGAAERPDVEHPELRRPPTGVELVLEVDAVQAERDRVVAMGWPLDEDLVGRPWGLTDFRVCDPEGYYLRITARAGPPPD